MAAHNTFDSGTIYLMFFGAIDALSSINKYETNCVLGLCGNNLRVWIMQNH